MPLELPTPEIVTVAVYVPASSGPPLRLSVAGRVPPLGGDTVSQPDAPASYRIDVVHEPVPDECETPTGTCAEFVPSTAVRFALAGDAVNPATAYVTVTVLGFPGSRLLLEHGTPEQPGILTVPVRVPTPKVDGATG